MATDLLDVSETYLELAREHLHRFRVALAVYFPDWAPHLALIELPGEVDYVPVTRWKVTGLLQCARTEEVQPADRRQLEFEWPSGARLEERSGPCTNGVNIRPLFASKWRTDLTCLRVKSVFAFGLDNNL